MRAPPRWRPALRAAAPLAAVLASLRDAVLAAAPLAAAPLAAALMVAASGVSAAAGDGSAAAGERSRDPAASPCAEATTTLAMTECLAAEIRRADALLERHLRVAQERLDRERAEAPAPGDGPGTGDGPEGRIDLAVSQRLWRAYRRAHCTDIARRWSGASLRPVMAAECLLRLSRERTREIWAAYLTHADRTPPLLPDPGPPGTPLPFP